MSCFLSSIPFIIEIFQGCVWEAHFALSRRTFAFQFFFFPSHNFLTFLPRTVLPCTIHESHKLHFSTTFSLKMGFTVLFTHLKIILLQCFSVFSFNYIQMDLKCSFLRFSFFASNIYIYIYWKKIMQE